jgi:molybdopterin-containing oxidoreductase family membrane subunit
MMTCNVISPQFFWFKAMRRNLYVTFALSIVVNIGMWFERFVIIVTSLHRDYLPSSWVMFYPTYVDVGDYLFSFGFFFTLFFLFAKFLPVINMAEVKAVLKSSNPDSANSYSEEVEAVVESDTSVKKEIE